MTTILRAPMGSTRRATVAAVPVPEGSAETAMAAASTARISALPVVVAGVVGVVMIIVSWFQASGDDSLAQQVGTLNLAVGGLVVLLLGCGFHVITYRRQIRQRTEHLVETLDPS